MHVHLMIDGHADYEYWDLTYMKRFRDEIMPASAKQLLMAGVTTVRDLGAPIEDILEVKRRIEKGVIPGPRLFVSMQAIGGATRWPARFLKQESNLGTLAVGRLADVIAVRGDVLSNIGLLQNVPLVFKGGVRVK